MVLLSARSPPSPVPTFLRVRVWIATSRRLRTTWAGPPGRRGTWPGRCRTGCASRRCPRLCGPLPRICLRSGRARRPSRGGAWRRTGPPGSSSFASSTSTGGRSRAPARRGRRRARRPGRRSRPPLVQPAERVPGDLCRHLVTVEGIVAVPERKPGVEISWLQGTDGGVQEELPPLARIRLSTGRHRPRDPLNRGRSVTGAARTLPRASGSPRARLLLRRLPLRRAPALTGGTSARRATTRATVRGTAFEPDFEEPDEPRRWDVLVWPVSSLCWEIRSPITYPQGIGLIPRPRGVDVERARGDARATVPLAHP